MLLYLDCFAGISGDMALGAFIDLGIPLEFLNQELQKLNLPGISVSVKPRQHMGITGQKIDIDFSADSNHRHYSQIKTLILSSELKVSIKELSLRIFDRIARAEAEIHGLPVEHVHFHEVGALDSIIDIVGTAICLDTLNVTRIMASKIPLGNGFVKCSHGRLPIPAPATAAILKGIPVYGTQVPHELVTPTGAAIVAELSESFQPLPDIIISRIGYGAGTRQLDDRPNLLRMILGESACQSQDGILVVEATIDDMNPEFFGYIMERLFEDGAKDVCLIPVYLKKNRPGTILQVICTLSLKERIIQRILSETTSLGVRFYPVERRILKRETVFIQTRYGNIQAKQIRIGDQSKITPEYDVCREIALRLKCPIKEVYQNILNDT